MHFSENIFFLDNLRTGMITLIFRVETLQYEGNSLFHWKFTQFLTFYSSYVLLDAQA